MAPQFEPYQSPLQSRLEPWRTEIEEMRALNWPCRAISEWLIETKAMQISGEGVRQFCKVRGITKGNAIPGRVFRQANRGAVAPKPAKLFKYDDSKPINIEKK